MIVEGRKNLFSNESFNSHEIPVINENSDEEDISEAISESKEIIDDSFLEGGTNV